MKSHQKLPPYGKSLADLQRSGKPLPKIIKIYIGLNAWDEANFILSSIGYMLPNVMILPPWTPANAYLWPVKNSHVMIFSTGWETEPIYIDSLAKELFLFGAKSVACAFPDYSIEIYKDD